MKSKAKLLDFTILSFFITAVAVYIWRQVIL